MCVSTFIKVCTVVSRRMYLAPSAPSPAVPGWAGKPAWKRCAGPPSMMAALSEYATTVPSGCALCVARIMPNSVLGCSWPSITHSALKILWRQCSLLACANIISSTSVGSRPRSVKDLARYSISSSDRARPSDTLASANALTPSA
ncbi:hypothetical protein D3C72_1533880 [compost metagenome]